MTSPDVLEMATARGSHELLNKLPHPTDQMKTRLANARHGDDSFSATMDQVAYEEEIRKYCMTLYREEVFKYIRQLVDEAHKNFGLQFSTCPQQELKTWSYIMFRTLGFNLGTSLKRLQGWFGASGKTGRKKNRPGRSR